jgi:hypothetical protein
MLEGDLLGIPNGKTWKQKETNKSIHNEQGNDFIIK